jgi:indolepyruvate ferredoxin oxidoreductase alpha subunit
MHSSQNEQDSRNYAIAAKLPMLEPSDSEECLKFTKLAYELSEKYDTPVFLRLTTRIAHARSLAEMGEREDYRLKPVAKDPGKYVMLPASAKKRHPIVEQRTKNIREYAETTPINEAVYFSRKIGVISAGVDYQYAREALGENASYLKLGMVNPLPVKLIRDFASRVSTLYVIECLDPVIENDCKSVGINVIGKDLFPTCGELGQNLIKKLVLGETPKIQALEQAIPVRPPVMCCGCPHRGLFFALKRAGVFVSGDIGCYTLGASPPLSAMDSCICMGASVSALHGFNKAREGEPVKSVSVIGDSTFIHSGITGLINTAYNNSSSVTIILDNSITGMTGHQQNPTTGYNIKGEPAASVDLEGLAKAVGIKRVTVVDPFHINETLETIKAALAAAEPSVIISRRPCALLKSFVRRPVIVVDAEKCVGCRACLRIGCPAISVQGQKAKVDVTQCVGCGLCAQLCAFGALAPVAKESE